jgi:hypothetical protein
MITSDALGTPKGVWIVYSWLDGLDVDAIYGTELHALRAAVATGVSSSVAFVEFGQDIRGAVREATS